MKSTDLITQKAQGAREERKRRRGGEGRNAFARRSAGEEKRIGVGTPLRGVREREREQNNADGSESRPYLSEKD